MAFKMLKYTKPRLFQIIQQIEKSIKREIYFKLENHFYSLLGRQHLIIKSSYTLGCNVPIIFEIYLFVSVCCEISSY